MSENDPFAAFESDRTVIKPSAGRLRGGAPAAPQPTADDRAPLEGSALPELQKVAGFNPLLQASTPLLRTAPRIRAMSQHPNPAALRAALIEGVRQFENDARGAGIPNQQVIAGRYILCTFLDEAASGTPWGSSGSWSTQSLLVHFHSESWGGEKVFQLLARLVEDVKANRDLLVLISVVLALGFEGRYRVIEGGRAQLEGVRDRLAQMLAQGPVEKELSPHWQGMSAAPRRVHDGLPVWVFGAAAAFLLMLAFIGLRYTMQDRSDPVFSALQALDVPAAPAPSAAPTPTPVVVAAVAPRLATFLKPDIDAGLVEVRDLADRSIVTIRGDGIFDAGSATVADRDKALIGRIADALNKVPGSVLVAGHTDNQPIRSVRFPSNWHLSQERARSVQAMLDATVDPSRVKAEGRADGEPIVPNDTPAGRARNRRVEITLMTPSAG